MQQKNPSALKRRDWPSIVGLILVLASSFVTFAGGIICTDLPWWGYALVISGFYGPFCLAVSGLLVGAIRPGERGQPKGSCVGRTTDTRWLTVQQNKG